MPKSEWSPADIYGGTQPTQLEVLRDLAATVRPPNVILEIGALRGKGSCYLGLGAQEGFGAHVYSVDPWASLSVLTTNENTAWTREFRIESRRMWQANVNRVGVADFVTPVECRSAEIAKVWRDSIGLLFIDGDHTAAGIRADYEGFAPYVVPGGWLAMHDYCPEWKAIFDFTHEVILASGEWEQRHHVHTLLALQRSR